MDNHFVFLKIFPIIPLRQMLGDDYSAFELSRLLNSLLGVRSQESGGRDVLLTQSSANAERHGKRSIPYMKTHYSGFHLGEPQ